MNYQNWQVIHKQAYEAWRQKQVTNYTPEENRARAWLNLTRHCTSEELNRLIELAEHYRNGKIHS